MGWGRMRQREHPLAVVACTRISKVRGGGGQQGARPRVGVCVCVCVCWGGGGGKWGQAREEEKNPF